MAGLESLVQNNSQPLGGSPTQSGQSYQLDQQLVELLAMQKMKSDKEMAARQIQLQMAAHMGTPPTIKQQRETELLDNTRNEIAQQAGATGQQQAAEQQAMMQKVMSGGIGGFAEGGSVGEWNDPQLAGTRSSSPIKKLVEAWRRANEHARRYQQTGDTEERGITTLGSGPMRQPAPAPPIAEEAPEEGVPPPAGNVDIESVLNTSPRARIQDTDIAPPEAPENPLLDNAINARLDPNYASSRAAEERGIASQYLGIPPEVQEQRKKYQEQLAGIDARQMDPKKLARQRLIAFLITAGRGHNLASGLGIGGAASANLQGEQESAERSRLVERQGVADQIAGIEQQSRAGIYGAGANRQTAVENQVSTAMNAAAQERRDLMDAKQAELDRAQEAKLEGARITAQKELENVRAGVSSKDSAVRAYSSLQANYDARLQAVLETARMFQLPAEQVQVELDLLESQYGELLEQLRGELGVGGEEDSGFTVRRVE